MAALSSSRASLLQLLCLLLAVVGLVAAANQQQGQPTPALPPVTLAGSPTSAAMSASPTLSAPRTAASAQASSSSATTPSIPPRPFINSSLEFGTDDRRTQIIVADLYYLTSKDGETKPNRSAWPIELVSVSLSDGKARLMGAFSYECRLNETHHSVRRQSINFGLNDSPFLLSDADNVLMGIGSNVIAEQTTGPPCQSYLNPLSFTDRPVNGSCDGQGCCHVNLRPVRSGSEVTIKKGTMYEDDGGFGGGSVSCSYAMIVEKTWYNFSSVDLDNDAFLRRNAAGVVPVVADFTIDLGGCPEAGEPTPKDFACISDNSECVDRPAADSTAHYCSCSVWQSSSLGSKRIGFA